jgi:hypothetical protein
MLTPSNIAYCDWIEGNWFEMMPIYRLADKKWRKSGLLLSFGYSAERFDMPNP